MLEKEKKIAYKIALLVAIFSLLISTSVLIGWFVNYEPILNLVPGSATMKVNTALIFLFGGINLSLLNNKSKLAFIIYIFLSVLIGIIGVFTLEEYLFNNNVSIDNLLVFDKFSNEFPGRMSPATAFNAILLSFGFIGYKIKPTVFKVIGINTLRISVVISFIAIVAYILNIPSDNRTSFFKTMAIHTSVLYFLQTIVLLFFYENSIFSKLIFQKLQGSKLFIKVLPIIILFPITFSFFLIQGLNNQSFNADFAITTFIVLNIPLTLIYIAVLALDLNKANVKELQLTNSLMRSNDRLQLYKDGLDKSALVVITDNNGVIKHVNNKYCRTSKYSRKELIGNTNRMVKSDFHKPKFFQNMWAKIRAGKIWKGEIKNKTKEGDYFWVSCTIIPFKDDNGNYNEFLAIMNDITKKKEAVALLKSDYVKKITDKNKELEQFAYVASHDLQEPLTTIISFLKVLNKKNQSKYDEKDAKYVRFILEASARMRSLIKSLLDYGRINKNEEVKLVNLNELVKDVLSDINIRIEKANAEIIVKELPTINCFETSVASLFQNLISNGIKFQHEGNTPKISINCEENKTNWKFKIKDNGIGINENQYDNIFKIFKRLNKVSEYEGTGIGLAHCKKIVDIHKGKIWVNSNKDNGSTFNFTISKNL